MTMTIRFFDVQTYFEKLTEMTERIDSSFTHKCSNLKPHDCTPNLKSHLIQSSLIKQ